jgi:hypothetical protein
MKLISLLLLLPTLAFAGKIPVEVFDQQKLEGLLRQIPSALVKTENQSGFVRKHYLFPQDKKAGFTIKCYADYYGTSTIPSLRLCDVDVTSTDLQGDEYFLKLDESDSQALYKVISYGLDVKKFFSFERVYGQAHDGKYHDLFRYSIICKASSCEFTFSPKEAQL